MEYQKIANLIDLLSLEQKIGSKQMMKPEKHLIAKSSLKLQC